MLKLLLPFLVALLSGCATPIEVQVLDHDTGKAVPGAQVRLLDRDWLIGFDVRGEGVTDSEGVARLRPVLSQIARIDVQAPGMRHLRSEADLNSGTDQRWEDFLRQARSDSANATRWTEYMVREKPEPARFRVQRLMQFLIDGQVHDPGTAHEHQSPAEADPKVPE